MADIAAVRITNIVSVTQGTNVYKGIRSVTITADKGRLLPILAEGDLYPTDAENVGMPDFPVTTSMVFEQDDENMLDLLVEAKADLLIRKKVAGGATDKIITINNHQFRRMSKAQNLQDFGRPSIEGVSHANVLTGNTLPISVAAAGA